jgi:DNA-directed RNA polymerase specialized sigma24 family protein
MDIFIKNYNILTEYAENLLYRMPWLTAKGYTAKDVVHETYIRYCHYNHKFIAYEDGKLVQVLKNLLYWTMKKMDKKDKESLTEEFILNEMTNEPLADERIFNKELAKLMAMMGTDNSEILNLRLAGYSYNEINSMRNTSDSRKLVKKSMSRLGRMLGIKTPETELAGTLASYTKQNLSISEMSRRTGVSPYLIKENLKGILGNRFKEYTEHTQKKKRRT